MEPTGNHVLIVLSNSYLKVWFNNLTLENIKIIIIIIIISIEKNILFKNKINLYKKYFFILVQSDWKNINSVSHSSSKIEAILVKERLKNRSKTKLIWLKQF